MFSHNEAKNLIVKTVENLQGCKATELAANPKIAIEVSNLNELIDELIQEGDIVAIEYIVPNMPDRIKIYLFPRGTNFKNSKSDSKI